MAEPERFLLPDADQAHHVADPADLPEELAALLAGERVLQLVAAIEVVLDGRLAAAVDHDDLLDARLHRLFDDELDGGRVDDGEHLLGDSLGGGEETRPQTGGGNDDLAQRMLHRGGQGSKGV